MIFSNDQYQNSWRRFNRCRGLVLGDYFETKPPFESQRKKKKSEFPDAFINRFGETEEVVIISNDKSL